MQNGGFSFGDKNMQKPLKEPKKFDEQVNILKDRKLDIPNEEEAIYFLRNNNYYRVSAYFKPLYNVKRGEIFKKGSSFQHIRDLYIFDSDLRKILVPILEKVEVAFRTHLAYYFAHQKGALGYEDKNNFFKCDLHDGLLENISKVTNNPKEKFLQFHKKKYNNRYPIWVLVEALSFGTISKFYSNMKNVDKTALCKMFYDGLDKRFLGNWIQVLVIARNICAHHGRLFNREIMTPLINKDMRGIINVGYEKRIFSVLLITKKLIKDKSLWNNFVYDLMYIIDKNNFTHFAAMGFQDDWQKHFVSSNKVLKQIKVKLLIKKN